MTYESRGKGRSFVHHPDGIGEDRGVVASLPYKLGIRKGVTEATLFMAVSHYIICRHA